jgi:hypothetical protein
MAAASAATGFRTWLQTHRFGWLTPRRMRALTIAVMSGAAIFATVGFSGSTPASSQRPSVGTTHTVSAIAGRPAH